MSADKILQKAMDIISGDRKDAYGDPKNSFEKIAELWTAYLGTAIFPEDVAGMMILLKVSRQKTGKGSMDNFVDIAGYAALGGGLYGKELSRNPDYPWSRDYPRSPDYPRNG